MASKTLTLYLHPETAEHLAEAKSAGRSAGAHVRLLEMHRELVARCIPSDVLDGHWSLMLEALDAHRIERMRDVLMLPYLVDEKIKTSDIAKRHLIDGERFTYRLRAMKLPELIAIAGELERRRSTDLR
jgi:hypothetical protein